MSIRREWMVDRANEWLAARRKAEQTQVTGDEVVDLVLLLVERWNDEMTPPPTTSPYVPNTWTTNGDNPWSAPPAFADADPLWVTE